MRNQKLQNILSLTFLQVENVFLILFYLFFLNKTVKQILELTKLYLGN